MSFQYSFCSDLVNPWRLAHWQDEVLGSLWWYHWPRKSCGQGRDWWLCFVGIRMNYLTLGCIQYVHTIQHYNDIDTSACFLYLSLSLTCFYCFYILKKSYIVFFELNETCWPDSQSAGLRDPLGCQGVLVLGSRFQRDAVDLPRRFAMESQRPGWILLDTKKSEL